MATGTGLIGKCGLFCGVCKLHIISKCKGCSDFYVKSETKCLYYECVEKKGINSCGNCQEFPCLDHYGSRAIYTKQKLLDWKKREIKGQKAVGA